METQFQIKGTGQLPGFAKKILGLYPDERIFVFYGPMGAGKTTFIKAFCSVMGIEDVPSSPTFSIINEYRSTAGESIFHFDFYRIEKLEEVYDIGYEEYVYSGDYCFMEWPEKIAELLPENFVYLKIEPGSKEDERLIKVGLFSL